MRRILIALVAVIALGLFTIPAVAGYLEYLNIRDAAHCRVIHHEIRREVEHRRFHRDHRIHNYRGRVMHRDYHR